MAQPIRPLLLAPVFLAAAFASSAPGQFPAGGGADAQRAKARLTLREGALRPGGEGALGVVLDVQKGWKIQAGLGSGDEVEPYIPTTVTFELPEGWSHGPIAWPAAREFTLGSAGWSETLSIYDGRVLFAALVRVPEGAAPGEYRIEAEVGYQACDDSVCEMPASARAAASVRVIAEGEAPAPAADEATLALFAEVLGRIDETPAARATPDAPAEGAAAPLEGAGPRPTFFGVALPRASGLAGLLLLALFSALGGFVLNLTPCVLPVIPIKIMTMMQHAGTPGRSLVLGLWMAAGVVAFWAGIGLPVAFLSSVTDPSQIFGIWWVTAGIGALIALMAVGIMGTFDLRLPQSVYAVRPKADTPSGSFAFGVMTAVLGLPCFGFVAGALLAGAATLPPLFILVIFTSLGVGMAAPYVVLAAKPSLVERIPRTGPASELVKQVMGLLLLAAAAYFLGSGLIALVSERPWLARQLHWWVVALFALAAAGWLALRTFQITRKLAPRASFLLLGLAIGGAAFSYANRSTGIARAQWELRQEALAAAGGGDYVPGLWNPFSEAAFERARGAGAVVVLDFTAEWCLICKYLKATVLDVEPVKSALSAEGVARFTVDMTSTSAPGWDFLRSLGQTGIPLLAIYAPGDSAPWLASAYTSQQVLDALAAARARIAPQR